MTSPATVPPPLPEPMSQAERVVDTFIAPRKTFTDLRRSANWLLPLLLLVIGIEAMVFVADKKIGFEKMTENGLAQQPKQAAKLDQLPPEQRARQMELIVKISAAASYASPLIVIFILLIVATVLFATFNYGMGAQLSFNQSIAIVMYASLPGLIKDALAIVVVMLGAGDNFTLQDPVASNLSSLVDPSSHFLHAIAQQADLFMIWTLVLTGIGFACLTGKKVGTCLYVVFTWWAVWIFGFAGFTALVS
jgi:Yip1 domain